MAAPIRIKIFGEQQAIFRLRNLQHRVADPFVALNRVADDMMRVIGVTFTGQGRRFGGSWHALDPATVRNKAREGEDPRILIASKRLMHSYTHRGHPDQRLTIFPDGITLDSSVPYAEVHQIGNDDVPQRKFIDFAPQDHQRWARMIRDDLMAAYRAGGRR